MVAMKNRSDTVSPLDRFILIRDHPFFHSITNQKILNVIQTLTEVNFKAGDNIVVQDNIIDSFYFILIGDAKIIQRNHSDSNNNTEIILGTLHKGDAIGLTNNEFNSVNGKHHVTVRALNAVKLLRIYLTDFSHLLQAQPEDDASNVIMADWILKIDFIKQAFPFSHTSVDRLCQIAAQINEITLPPNSLIFSKNSIADNCYLIREGQVNVYRDDTMQTITSTLEVNAVFGESDILTSGKRTSSVSTATTCKLLILPHQLLIQMVKNNEPMGQALVGLVLKRMCPERMSSITEHTRIGPDGTEMMMLHNQKLAQVYRLTHEGQFIWQQINGNNSLQQITMAFFKSSKVFAPEMIYNFLYNLAELKFIYIPEINVNPEASKFERLQTTFKKYVQAEFIFRNADPIITYCYQYGMRIFFSWLMQVVMIGMISWGIYAFFHYTFLVDPLKQQSHYFIRLFVFIFFTSMLTASLHELAHAFATKHYGYQLQRLGFSWQGFELLLFADTSELWLAPRWPRIVVDFAGIYWDCVVASLFALAAYYLASPTLSIYLWLYSLLLYITCYRNLSILKDYDGYFMLADAFDMPKLRENAYAWLGQDFLMIKQQPLQECRDHWPEIIYWLTCLTYIGVYSVIVYQFLNFFSRAFDWQLLFGYPIHRWINGFVVYAFTMPIVKIFIKLARIHSKKNSH